MKSKRMERKRKRQERRRRYKKNHQSLFLSLKIACICYLTIFGTSYMSSGTSAFFSNQNTVESTITTGTWDVPAINYCGEQDENDAVSGEEIIVEREENEDILSEENMIDNEESEAIQNEEGESAILPVFENDVDPIVLEELGATTETDTLSGVENSEEPINQDESIEENEQNVDTSEEINIEQVVNEENLVVEGMEEPDAETGADCVEKDDESMEAGEEEAVPVKVDCKDENTTKEEQDITLSDEIEQDVTSDEESKKECGDIEDGAKKESDNDDAAEDEQATEGSKELDENANAENDDVDLDDSKKEQKPEDVNQIQPVNKDTQPVTESTDMKPDTDSMEEMDPKEETNAAIKEEKENAEGDSNEREKEQKEDKDNEMGE